MTLKGNMLFNRPGSQRPRDTTFYHEDIADEGDNTIITIPANYEMQLFYFIASNGGSEQIEVVTYWGGAYRFGYYLNSGAAGLQNFIGAETRIAGPDNFVVYLGADGTVKVSVGYIMYEI